MSDADLDRTWVAISRNVDSAPLRRRGSKIALLGGSLAIAVAIGGTAAAGALLDGAHTGKGPRDQEDIVLGGPGERLDPAGSDFAQVVVDETRELPFPSERARQISNRTQTRELQHIDALVSTGALRGFTADDAVCSWANSWAAAVKAGDTAAQRSATEVLLAASSWPAVTALDTELEMRTTTQTDQDGTTHELSDNTRFWYLPLVQAAAQGDDIDAMGAALATHVRCIPELVPDLTRALPKKLRP